MTDTPTLSPEALEELGRLEKAATSAPWRHTTYMSGTQNVEYPGHKGIAFSDQVLAADASRICDESDAQPAPFIQVNHRPEDKYDDADPQRTINARLIVAARNALPALLAEREAAASRERDLVRENERLRNEIDSWRSQAFSLQDRLDAMLGGGSLADLVSRFSAALLAKLKAAEIKYGHNDGWMNSDWKEELNRKLREHVDKGDPRDVAAYCAFAWHHSWSLADPASEAREADLIRRAETAEEVAEGEKRLANLRGEIIRQERARADAATAQIAALQERVGVLEGALRPFAEALMASVGHYIQTGDIKITGVSLGDLRAASVALADAEPAGTPAEVETCDRCAGNGEIITNWDRYLHARKGDVGDEAVSKCPKCSGTGEVPAEPATGGKEGGALDEANIRLRFFRDLIAAERWAAFIKIEPAYDDLKGEVTSHHEEMRLFNLIVRNGKLAMLAAALPEPRP